MLVLVRFTDGVAAALVFLLDIRVCYVSHTSHEVMKIRDFKRTVTCVRGRDRVVDAAACHLISTTWKK